MKLHKLFFWDIKFQIKYGFYLLYGFLTLIYIALILSLPLTWRNTASSILIFSDPAAMGLFFMGAIILLEKSQRVTSYYAVSPVSAMEYVFSKVLSLCAIGLTVSLILSVPGNTSAYVMLILGTVLGSFMFSLIGIIIATKITSLNQFLLATVPIEVICFVPAIMHLFGITTPMLSIFPPNCCMDLISGRNVSIPGILLLFVVDVFLFLWACKSVQKMWSKMGGGRL